MPRVRRGYGHVTGGNGTSKYKKGTKTFIPKTKEASIDPPIVITSKFPGKCKVCLKKIKVGIKVYYNGSRIWHLDCESNVF